MKTTGLTVTGCLALTALVGWWLWSDRPGPSTGATYAKDGFSAHVNLTVSKLLSQENDLIGAVSVRLGVTSEVRVKDAEAFRGLDSVWLQIQRSQESDGQNEIIIIGDSDGPMKIGQGLGLYTEGTFRWRVEAVRGSAAYPFDMYVARIHPALFGQLQTNPGVWMSIPVHTLGVDFSGANFDTSSYSRGSEDRTWFTVSLTRPLWLRVVAVIGVALLLVWGVSFPLSSKATEPAGLLALFGGVFSLRTSLVSGAPVFPCLIDYLSILLYIYVVAMLLLRPLYVKKSPECPFCKSPVRPDAGVCPACTRTIARAGR